MCCRRERGNKRHQRRSLPRRVPDAKEAEAEEEEEGEEEEERRRQSG